MPAESQASFRQLTPPILDPDILESRLFVGIVALVLLYILAAGIFGAACFARQGESIAALVVLIVSFFIEGVLGTVAVLAL